MEVYNRLAIEFANDCALMAEKMFNELKEIPPFFIMLKHDRSTDDLSTELKIVADSWGTDKAQEKAIREVKDFCTENNVICCALVSEGWALRIDGLEGEGYEEAFKRVQKIRNQHKRIEDFATRREVVTVVVEGLGMALMGSGEIERPDDETANVATIKMHKQSLLQHKNGRMCGFLDGVRATMTVVH